MNSAGAVWNSGTDQPERIFPALLSGGSFFMSHLKTSNGSDRNGNQYARE